MNLDKISTARSLSCALLAARYLLPIGRADHDTLCGPRCSSCGYSLVGLPDNHRCPECGQAYQARESGDPNWRYAGRWLVLWGLLLGIGYAAVFRLVWKGFGEYQYIRFVPVAFVLAADLAFGGYRLLAGAARVASGREADGPLNLPALLTVVLVAVGKYALLLSLPMGTSETANWNTWRGKLGPLYPLAVYRPLILMPLWGRWAMTLAMSIGRVGPLGSFRLVQMAGRTRLPLTMGYCLLCTILTMVYTRGHADRGLVIALGVMVATYLSSYVLARRHGGQTEATVGTTGLVAEMAFLLLYRAIASPIYWY